MTTGLLILAIFLVAAVLMFFRLLPAMLALPLMAVAIAGIEVVTGRLGAGNLARAVLADGSTRLADAMVIAMLGGMLSSLMQKAGVAESIVHKGAELAGDNPWTVSLIMLGIATMLFTTVGGLGAVIMLGTIVLPILASMGVREHIAAGILVLGISLGGLLNAGNWVMYRSGIRRRAGDGLQLRRVAVRGQRGGGRRLRDDRAVAFARLSGCARPRCCVRALRSPVVAGLALPSTGVEAGRQPRGRGPRGHGGGRSAARRVDRLAHRVGAGPGHARALALLRDPARPARADSRLRHALRAGLHGRPRLRHRVHLAPRQPQPDVARGHRGHGERGAGRGADDRHRHAAERDSRAHGRRARRHTGTRRRRRGRCGPCSRT